MQPVQYIRLFQDPSVLALTGWSIIKMLVSTYNLEQQGNNLVDYTQPVVLNYCLLVNDNG